MRDGEIIRMHQVAGRREGLILAQLEYLKTRQEAMERVDQAASLWARLMFFFAPRRRWAAIAAVQDYLLAESRKELDAAAARAKVAVPPEQLGQAIIGKGGGLRG